MTISDEQLSAFLDGELAPKEADEVTAAIAADPALAARLEGLRGSDAWLKEQYAALDARPIRQDTLDLIAAAAGAGAAAATDSGDGAVVDLSAERSRRSGLGARVGWGHGIAASVALLVGIGLGNQLAQGPAVDPAGGLQFAGAIAPDSPYHDAFERTPSGMAATFDGVTVTPTMSFRTQEGDICRDAQISSDAGTSRALVCRESNAGWAVRMTVAAAGPAGGADGTFVPASDGTSILMDNAILALMAGDALGAAEEGTLIEGHWRPVRENNPE